MLLLDILIVVKIIKELNSFCLFESCNASAKVTEIISDEKMFNTCQISNLENRRIGHLRNLMFNRKSQCNCMNEDENICTRSNTGPIFNVLKPNSDSFKRNVCFSGAVEWNNLDVKIRNSGNIFLFKKIQKAWLADTYS